jgi:hypothetical protein
MPQVSWRLSTLRGLDSEREWFCRNRRQFESLATVYVNSHKTILYRIKIARANFPQHVLVGMLVYNVNFEFCRATPAYLR